jgi:hypothetical protein
MTFAVRKEGPETEKSLGQALVSNGGTAPQIWYSQIAVAVLKEGPEAEVVFCLQLQASLSSMSHNEILLAPHRKQPGDAQPQSVEIRWIEILIVMKAYCYHHPS